MEEWIVVGKIFASEHEARKFEGIVQITESRLANTSSGPQFDVETDLIECQGGWQIRWRKVFVGYKSGCGSCGSCNNHILEKPGSAKKGTVIEFRPK